MKKVLFMASVAAYERWDDLNTVVLALAAEADGEGSRVEFQRGIVPDPQDEALGMNTYCICLETGATHYGGLAAWRIADAVLDLQFTAAAAKALGVAHTVRIGLTPLSPDILALVDRGLREIVGTPTPAQRNDSGERDVL